MKRRAGLRYSLAALRAFEAVARLGSLTEAAGELGVSVSAVGLHVRQLQRALDAELIQRSGRGIRLTHAGASLARDLAGGFAALDAAVERFSRSRSRGRVIDVSVLPVFATRWLIPRLSSFQRAHPGIEVRVATTERRVDLEREGYDFAVRSGRGDWPGLNAVRLFSQQLTPICSRAYAEEAGIPATAAELAGHRLINNESRADEWSVWSAEAGAPRAAVTTTQTYDSREAVLQAVLSGLGLGIADRSLLTDELARGDLIAPFHTNVPTGWASYLVWPDDEEQTEAAHRFRSWLLAAACSPVAAPPAHDGVG